jgi:FtsP/CotA-like multicopper oxidase with cupredoxin domain
MRNLPAVANPPRRTHRRKPVRLALAALLVLAVAEPVLSQPRVTQAPRLVQGGRLLRIPRGPLLGEPFVVSSVNRLLNAELTVIDTTLNVPSVGSVRLRAYKLTAVNGEPVTDVADFPGPTFSFSPGDSVRIRLVNRLPLVGDDSTCLTYTTRPPDVAPNCFHGSNWTNIHYHGMHVTPDGTGDNVLISIGPDSTWQFAYGVPMNQSPGTHWYHPHKHGSVAQQVTNGMAGALLVRGGGLDSLVRAQRIRERLLAVQQVDSQVNLVGGLGVGSGIKLVNGQSNPTVIMRPREVQRWRLVNENVSISTTYKLLFAPESGRTVPTLYDIARDGVQFAPANYSPSRPDDFLTVAPGNRLDMFVQAPAQAGTYELRAEVSSLALARNELPFAANRAVGAAQPLLTVLVVDDGFPVQTQLPAALPPLPDFLQNLPTPADTSVRLVFSDEGRKGGSGPSFFLGLADNPRVKFDPDSALLRLPLDQTQLWKVSNRSVDSINHPFHIHVNPFQVLRVVYPRASDPNIAFYQEVNQAAANGNPYWMDVFPLPLSSGNTEGYIVIRQRYDDFTGSFVMHCHILGHEERGMMALIRIVGPGGAVGSASGGHGAHPPGTHP